ncbi:hypothetical protein [Bacillus sp. AG4(2022)]|uniref:hypothetical protein n=1 Tax=Bacillus sp. AG4(2022) TaxID=2962594 RepID=UPI0028810990|nr:hypothetical protein [Bacillus sp. AG4(2022)]MDT0160359.1 hypothetical protein [Bacillus sp. AG4(2022)]
MKFTVKSDEEFFNKFSEIQTKIKSISSTFQNGDTELSAEELGNFNLLCNETKQEFTQLLKEARNRITTK